MKSPARGLRQRLLRLGGAARRLSKRRRALVLAAVAAAGLFIFFVLLVLLWPMDVDSYLRVQPSGEMLDRNGKLLYAFTNANDHWQFSRGLDEISPLLIQATIATEDHRFRHHPGVDPFALCRAVWQNLAGRRVVSGASTIAMQVVKEAGSPRRSWLAKFRQAVQAVRLECRASKDEILRAYLNRAPYGLNLLGCEAAARRYFGKPAAELTLAQAALIAGLPRAPTALSPLKHPEAATKRRNYVLSRMSHEGFITEDERRRASLEPLGAKWLSFPDLAPHLAMRLKPLIGKSGRLRTTIDAEAQITTARLARESLGRFSGQIGNAAVLVLDAPSASVLAHVGSGSFFETPGGGQADASQAPRSPGSALKPFIYALAIERNCLYPSETLLDAPLDYGQYNPENFDRRRHGLLSASEALRRSLNVPAIVVLERVGGESVYSFLKNAGLTTLTKPASHYGMGLALGSCEVRLDELAAAYAMLTNLGDYRPLTVLADSRPEAPRRLLSAGTCLSLHEMLEQALPRELDRRTVQASSAAPRVGWKTGTSNGRRDSWAVVFNRQYVVAVWMGNNDSAPSNQLVGARAALPLAADVFRSLKPKTEPDWPGPGRDLRPLRVCALSGLPASSWCPNTAEALVPSGEYAHRTCDVHYPALGASGSSAPGPNPSPSERWPASARHWDLARISNVPSAADPGPAQRQSPLKALSILDPADKAEFILAGEPNADRLRLRSSLDEQQTIYWYLDDTFLKESAPQKPILLDLKAGNHKLACMTPDGLFDRVEFQVRPASDETRFVSSEGPPGA